MSHDVDLQGRRVTIYDADDIENMRSAGRKAATVLDEITPLVQAGVSTKKLNDLIDGFMRDLGGVPATLGYKGYPASSCISVNHVVNHGIPSETKILAESDIVNIDVTILDNGWHGDSSRMFLCGDKVPQKGRKLVDTTYDAMMAGIAAVAPGRPINVIGKAIESVAKPNRASIVESFVGHGVGLIFHDSPAVFNYYCERDTLTLEEGMIFTVEPMLNAGRKDVKILNDGWTAVTRDRSLSAQFEHSIVVTAKGCEILTLSPMGYTKPPYPV
ncbi:MAG: type I methionyl aminopeptidase [Alphaproteobacteria bacterium]|nr:type I methionyl aminopeptidase [Alphaproteobacteria bacterium]